MLYKPSNNNVNPSIEKVAEEKPTMKRDKTIKTYWKLIEEQIRRKIKSWFKFRYIEITETLQ